MGEAIFGLLPENCSSCQQFYFPAPAISMNAKKLRRL
jgi:hypothetical protein